MHFILPAKPDFLNEAEWIGLLDRSNRRCERRACDPATCEHYAKSQGRLQTDHEQCRKDNGEDSLANCRFVCEHYNLSRPEVPAEKWLEPSYFDQAANFAVLRQMQFLIGPQQVRQHAELFVGRRLTMLELVTLMVAATGVGKTLAIFSTLLAINEVVQTAGPGRPRVRKVLLLVNERALCDSLAEELRCEPVKFQLVEQAPKVKVMTGGADLNAGPLHYDICVSCPHALWDIDSKNGQRRRTAAESAKILAQWDTIVFDECDFATLRLHELRPVMRHAIKIAMTATPIEANGELIKGLVLTSRATGIADYSKVRELDRCLKVLPKWDGGKGKHFLEATPHGSHHRSGPDGRVICGGEIREHSLPTDVGAVLRAVQDADALESQMKEERPSDYFSPHILVRVDRVQKALLLRDQLRDELLSIRHSLDNPGWDVTVMADGLERKKHRLEDDELRLTHRPGSGLVNPWMRAKRPENGGRADKKSKRIMIICQMAIRGTNNWPCLFVVDLARSFSIPLLVQLMAPGRPGRLPSHLQSWLDSDLEDFITIRFYVPNDGAGFGAADKAVNFAHQMKAYFSSMPDWSDVLAGKATPEVEIRREDPADPFTEVDRLAIANGIGFLVEYGVELGDITDDDLTEIINKLVPEPKETRRERGMEYAGQLRDDDGFRQRELLGEPVEEIVRPAMAIKPRHPSEYADEEILQFAKTSRMFSVNREWVVGCLEGPPDQARIAQGFVAHALHEHERRLYREPTKALQLQATGRRGELGFVSGVLTDLADDLADKLWRAGTLEQRAAYGLARQYVNWAAQKMFGLPSAANDSAMDQPQYHYAIVATHGHVIRDMARAAMIQAGVLHTINALLGGADDVAAE